MTRTSFRRHRADLAPVPFIMTHFATFGGTALLLVRFAAWLPARRATRISAIEALRVE